MKKFLWLFLLLPHLAFAQSQTEVPTWNPLSGVFQAMVKGLGMKEIPEHRSYRDNATAGVANHQGGVLGGVTSSDLLISKVGRTVTLVWKVVVTAGTGTQGINSGANRVPLWAEPIYDVEGYNQVQESPTDRHTSWSISKSARSIVVMDFDSAFDRQPYTNGATITRTINVSYISAL